LLYIFLGQNDFSLRVAVEEVKGELGDGELLAANTTQLGGRQLSPEQLMASCDAAPFLAPHRLVIVEGLLSRFEPRRGGGRKGRHLAPESEPADQLGAISAYIRRKPLSTVLILIDGRIRGDNPLLKKLAPGATVKTFPPLRGAALQRWIRTEVSSGGGSISPPAVAALAELVGENLWIMKGEIEKLLLYARGRRIEGGDVEEVVGYAREASVFTMVDALLQGRVALAAKVLHQLLAGGAAPAYLLMMITRQLRLMIQVKELSSQRLSAPEIQNRAGLASSYAFSKTLAQARAYPREWMHGAYRRLLEIDLAIKTGRYGDELALDLLVAELFRDPGAGSPPRTCPP
jgi:DNA polymerase-3 subunit delta